MGLLSSRPRSRLGLLKSYVSRQPHVSGGPLSVTIESNAKRNLFCPMCPRETTYFPPRDMGLSLFKKIIGDGKDYLESAVPCGVSEPLLNPKLIEMISYCENAGIPTGICTNAATLTENMSQRLISSGLVYIIFAFGGATQAGHGIGEFSHQHAHGTQSDPLFRKDGTDSQCVRI